WLPVNVRTNPKLSTLYFADETLGWAAGDDGLVLRTDAGGFSWRRLTEGGRDDVSQLFFWDNSHGWAVGARGKILFTSSGGKNWTVSPSGTHYPSNASTFLYHHLGIHSTH